MITVNSNCVKCGFCADTCPVGIIVIQEDGPKLIHTKACIRCGHCVAVCPHAAMDHTKAPLGAQASLEQTPMLDPDMALLFLRSRRSIRCYKEETVPQDKMLQLLEAARFAPSGGNSQGLSYLVVSQREKMQKLTEITIDWMEEQIKQGVPWLKPYSGIIQVYRSTGRDVILRDAPNLVVALAPKSFPLGRDNARYSLAYVELFAPSLGLGTCWAGFLEMCAASGCPELYNLLEVPEGMNVAGAVMVGFPKYKYHRLVDRNPLQVTWR